MMWLVHDVSVQVHHGLCVQYQGNVFLYFVVLLKFGHIIFIYIVSVLADHSSVIFTSFYNIYLHDGHLW